MAHTPVQVRGKPLFLFPQFHQGSLIVALPEPQCNVVLGLTGRTFAITIPVFRGTREQCQAYLPHLPSPNSVISIPPLVDVMMTIMTDEELANLQQEITR